MERTLARSRNAWITLVGFFQLLISNAAYGTTGAVPVSAGNVHSSTSPWVKRVVLVHGIYNPFLGNIQKTLEARGWHVYTVRLKPSDGSVDFNAMAEQLAQFVKANVPAGAKFDLVGFSMGGLVTRYYVQKLGGASRVRRLVTISAPNHGTIWAYLSGRAGVKQMRPGSEMLNELNSESGMLAPLDYTSIYTPLDLTIMPSNSSRMGVARNVVTWVPLHPLMVWMAAPMRAIERALE